MTQTTEGGSYRWYAFDGSEGNDVCVLRRGGGYVFSIHSRKFPDPPFCWLSRGTPEKALEAARRAMKRYRRPFDGS